MKFCKKCQLEMEDKFKFCYQCGGKLEEQNKTVFCPYCGEKMETDGKFCPFCGQSFTEETVSVSDEPVVQKNYVKMQPLSVKKEEAFFTSEIFFSSEGRMGRLDYFKVCVFWGVLGGVLSLIGNIFSSPSAPLILSVMFYPVNWYSGYCIFVKRFHDLGKSTDFAQKLYIFTLGIGFIVGFTAGFSPRTMFSAWPLYVLLFLAFIGLWLYLIFKKGDLGPNQYGPEP